MKTKPVTFFGPTGATFSHQAYNILARYFNAPQAVDKGKDANCIPSRTNSDILPILAEHGGYGAIAMETLAECRVTESVEAFADLLKKWRSSDECPFHVIGAVKMKLHFCLMTGKGKSPRNAEKIVAHKKAIGACKNSIASIEVPAEPAPNDASNGEAARLVAEDPSYANCAVIGPRSAAEQYGLEVHTDTFEDKEAVTTFFLLGPKEHQIKTAKENRLLVVFKIQENRPGALVATQIPFRDFGINMIQIHSIGIGDENYNFAIEVKVFDNQLGDLEKAMAEFRKHVTDHIVFGPFPVLSA